MIAIRRLLFRGWEQDSGLRIHVVHPASVEPRRHAPTPAESADAERRREQAADRQRRHIETLWTIHGGR